jgi:tetratricopeptide (TPR) repeat protein
LVTPYAQLRALLHSGLAYCRAQEFHHLGRFKPQVLDEALRHAETAGAEWTKYQDEQKQRDPRATVPLHPLIPYTLALVTTVNEGAVADHSERVARFTRACELYARAIALDPHNGLFHNNLGWVLLKLAQWGIDQGGLAGGTPTVLGSEEHLRRSLELNPRNRLTHANLCLLYSLPHFRDQTGSLYLSRCRYHGLKAVQLEKRYINGYRDLAVALVRYGELDEAYTHFVEALRLADSPEKDQEIIRDVVAEVEQRGESPPELERWRQPDPKLLHPRVSLTGVQRSATGG